MTNNAENIEILSFTDGGGGDVPQPGTPSTSRPDFETPKGPDPLITLFLQLQTLTSAMNEESDRSGEKTTGGHVWSLRARKRPLPPRERCVRPAKGTYTLVRQFDPKSQKPVCSPCAEKEITINPSIIVDSEATTRM